MEERQSEEGKDPFKEATKRQEQDFYYKAQIGATPTRVDVSRGVTADQWIDGDFWIKVISSNVDAIKYAKGYRELYVRFLTGDVYRYSQVAPQTAEQMFLCASMGRFVHQRLRNKFSYRKM